MTRTVISSGQIVSGAAINSGDRQVVFAGGTSLVPRISDGGVAIVSSGGSVAGASLHVAVNSDAAPARMVVLSGGVATDTGMGAGGRLMVDGGSANGTLVSGSGSTELLISGASASGTVIADGGRMVLGAFPFTSTATDTTVGNGGVLHVGRDCPVRDTTVLAGGLMRLDEGRGDTGITISSGGRVVAYDDSSISGITVDNGGVLVVKESDASNVDVRRGGRLVVRGGASLSNIAKGGTVVVEDGRIDGIQSMSAGGLIVGKNSIAVISSGNTTTGGIVSAGGVFAVVSGATAIGLKLVGGSELDYRGGAVSGLIASHGATEVVEYGATVSGLDNPGTYVIVSNGGTAVATHIQAGTLTVMSGGIATDTQLRSAHETVSAGGRISGTTTFAHGSTVEFDANTGISLKASGFDSTDAVDLAAFKFGGSRHLTVVSSGTTTQLTITEGLQQAKVILLGQYSAAGFHLAKDGAGTTLTYTPATNTPHELAAGHGH